MYFSYLYIYIYIYIYIYYADYENEEKKIFLSVTHSVCMTI
jgi:hypothetical protein